MVSLCAASTPSISKVGVGFGIAQSLRFLEHDIEVETLVAHFGKDEVGGAVDDAGNPLNAVGSQAFTQGLDDRDATGHGRFERHHHALFLGGLEDFIAVRGNQRLVGGNHVLAVGNRLQHQILGDAITADQFDDDIDVRIADQQIGIVDDFHFSVGQLGGARRVQVGHHGNFNGASCTPRNFFLIALQHIESTGTHGADAEQTYFDGFHIVFVIDKKSRHVHMAGTAVILEKRIQCAGACAPALPRSGRAVPAPVTFEEMGNAAHRLGQVIRIGQEHDAEMIRASGS